MQSPLLTTEEWERGIGVDIRRLRLRRRLTQAELAERANVSLSAVQYLEKGRGSSLSTVVRVIRALDRSDWLASLVPPEPTISPMAILRERQRARLAGPQRVRHAATNDEGR